MYGTGSQEATILITPASAPAGLEAERSQPNARTVEKAHPIIFDLANHTQSVPADQALVLALSAHMKAQGVSLHQTLSPTRKDLLSSSLFWSCRRLPSLCLWPTEPASNSPAKAYLCTSTPMRCPSVKQYHVKPPNWLGSSPICLLSTHIECDQTV